MYSTPGEASSPLPLGQGADVGELRLQSDANLARGKYLSPAT
jgi:hypothetical protein